MWEVAASGRRWICKEHRRGRGFAQERRAYAAWSPRLAAWLAPVVAIDVEDGGALLLERLEGAPPAGDGDAAAHREAGRFVAALAEVPVAAADPMAPGEALGLRVEAATRRAAAAGVATAGLALEARARELGRDLPARRWCHRDFDPRNWLVAGDRLRVVDLEHARPDLPGVDEARLTCGAWRRRPELRAAFVDGLGRRPEPDEEALRWLLADLHAVTTITWGRGRREAVLAEEAAAHLEARRGV